MPKVVDHEQRRGTARSGPARTRPRRRRRSWPWWTGSPCRRASSRAASRRPASASWWTRGWTSCARSSFEPVTTDASRRASVEPLRFEDGALVVLDQRALPDEERWIRCETVEQVAGCIRTLAVRGAPAIGIAAAYGMALADDREA